MKRMVERRSHEHMTPAALRQYVSRLPAPAELTSALEASMAADGRPERWAGRQKEHWLGWLGDYDGPGYYGRADWDRTAEFVYNHFQCAPGLLWLAEAAGAKKSEIVSAIIAVVRADSRSAAQCAAVRRVFPWSTVETLLRQRRPR